MTHDHDFVAQPELRNNQLEEHQFSSPHPQITEDFDAKVVKVHDGDTVRVTTNFRDFDFPIRLLDIDAPEMNQGGEVARDFLSGQILDKLVTVKINRENRVDKYGRLLGHIVHGGIDMGEVLLRQGLVTTFKQRREQQIPDINRIFNLKQWL